ncbi:MAG: hypothetical protein RLZZ502_442 [Pseudomonadota bacterium]
MASKATIHIILSFVFVWFYGAHLSANTPELYRALAHSCQTQKNSPMCADFAQQTTETFPAWLASKFDRQAISTPAFITGYYQPIVPGSTTKTARFSAPLYLLPANPAHSRAALRQARHGDKALPVLAYVEDEVEAFFIGIQGSALLDTERGQLSVTYAGHNGQAYHAIGKTLVQRGALTPDALSMESIKSWLRAHPESQAEVLDSNPRVIYFKAAKPAKHPQALGAQGLPLTPGHSVAVDPSQHAYGSLLYLEADGLPQYLIAQDTGAAIKGEARLDLFTGSGEAAGKAAGSLKRAGKLWRLHYRP